MRVTVITGLAFVSLAASAQTNSTTKPPIHGLVTMGTISFLSNPALPVLNNLAEANAHPSIYSGVVLLGKWMDLEPARGKFDFQTIDAGLDAVRVYNKKYPSTPVVAKLRIFGAVVAPAWVMKLDGGPVIINHHDADRTVGKFWTPDYTQAWRELQIALAARYDSDPLVEEVAITSCTPNAGEPILVPVSEHNIPLLKAAGYTDAAFETCVRGFIDDYAPWKHVAIDLTLNPFRRMDTGHAVFDEAITEEIMKTFRKRLGSRGVIANHGIDAPPGQQLSSELAQIQNLGPPMEFQTAHPHGNWDVMFALEMKLGATEVELWDSKDAYGSGTFTAAELHLWHDALVATAKH